MPWGLERWQGGHDLHFLTFCCYHRQPLLAGASRRDLFLRVLEQVRQRYQWVVLGGWPRSRGVRDLGISVIDHLHSVPSIAARGNAYFQSAPVVDAPELWRWSSFRSYAFQEPGLVKLNDWSAHKLRFTTPTTFPQ